MSRLTDPYSLPFPSLEGLPGFKIQNMALRGEVISLTARPFEMQLDELRLKREHLEGKRVLAIGAGITDFVSEANSLKGCQCQGHDPLYRLVAASETLEDCLQGLWTLGIVLIHDGFAEGLEERFFHLKRELEQNGDRYSPQRFEELDAKADFDLIVACHVTEYLHPEQTRESLRRAYEALRAEGQISIMPFNSYVPDPFSISVTLQGGPSWFLNHWDDGSLLEILEENASRGMQIYAGLGPRKSDAYTDDPEMVSHDLLILCRNGTRPCYVPPDYGNDPCYRDMNLLRIYPGKRIFIDGVPGCAAEAAEFQ